MADADRTGKSGKKVKVLVAVQPISLFHLMKHLLSTAPEIQLVSSPEESDSLTQKAKRFQPDLVITNARQLGEGARALLADTRRASPRSRIILTYFDTRVAGAANELQVDEFLEEELLVKRLIPAVRRLSSRGRVSAGTKRRTALTKLSPGRKVG